MDEIFMRRCLELAEAGKGNTSPNPMVGSVVVHEGQIIGEGYHRRAGEPHAEVNAIAAVQNPNLLSSSTLYVNLEPCAHYGKTPPCTDLIIEKNIRRVVVACLDPFPAVSGQGICRLQRADVEIVTGILEREARSLNKVFITFHEQHRPYIFLKWAQSIDGFIDRLRIDTSSAPVRFSSTASRRIVHKLRSEVAAIMIGRQTAELDNPSLTVRYWAGLSPVRLVLGRRFVPPPQAHLSDRTVETLFFSEENMDYNRPLLPQVLAELYARKLDSLLVEGGATLLNSFLEAGLWDEAHVEVVPFFLGKGVIAPTITTSSLPILRQSEEKWTDGRRILHYYANSLA
ncbi:MAG: bifunctional diaminohydroxyphosphoribosylaminopyrimidine deaminase/5-amino-6-(5-phosphoribosylamino)uracil reductase RibD [Tannerellaceae bacterium]|jgi:diaminohydroxyphosphoribosylaminopyrimidine deaminase/5-amino-6-(5-phosphoribosylamino)uracil reductase|nr:bifunctional diaminohydroxyphosphoribosylaminopyrimidine deaminase/5-amino-6-(5-phosphoribosylamino)uracil reductase RibD [Tannerellaceae bacterium]